ncbi:MAG: hypothetical protein ACXVCV_17360, partial [Polyangia bacterium]
MLLRAVAWSLGVHAAALGGAAWLLATPPSLASTVALVTSDAAAVVVEARDERSAPTAVEFRA